MASSINVKIAPLPRGEYSSSATYAKLDVVSYNGSAYMAIKAVPTGTVPTNTTYWQLLAEKPTIGEGSITTDMLAEGAVTADKLDSSVSDKYAEVSGTYEDMVVGSAEQLLSTQYDTDSVPYAFRKSPYGDREIDEIVGGSIAWNQLLGSPQEASSTKNGITFTKNNDNSISVSGTATAMTTYTVSTGVLSVVPNHKMLIVGCPAGGSTDSYRLSFISSVSRADVGNGYMFISDSNSSGGVRWIQIVIQGGYAITGTIVFKPQLFDLTQMFGSAIADYIYSLEQSSSGSGVAWFKSLFPKPYYAYNTGELISVSGLSAHKMTGFNQWDEEWEVGGIGGTGANQSANDRIRSKNYIPVVPNATYYYYLNSTYGLYTWGYDADKNYVGRVPSNGYAVGNNTVTIPSDICYIRIVAQPNYGTTYKHDICINISGERNGQYEPYESHSYALDDSLTLRGVPKLVDNKVQFDGDIYSSDGTVQRRYGIMDMGTLSWTKYTDTTNTVFYSLSISDMDTTSASIMCSKYVTSPYWVSVDSLPDKTIEAHPTLGRVYCRDESYSTAEAFKSAMSGVYLVYELATPTTESASSYVNPQICNEYGTEEYVSAEQSGVTMIVGHNTKYPQNLRKKIEGLPWNFSSLIAPTEATNKATRNYTVGSYLIMNNTLYKVTSAIANGGTITVGTNVTATTIMAEILAL